MQLAFETQAHIQGYRGQSVKLFLGCKLNQVEHIQWGCLWQSRLITVTLRFLSLPEPCQLPFQFLRTDRLLPNASLLMKWQVSDNKLSWQDTSDLLHYSDSSTQLHLSETASFGWVSTRYSPGGEGMESKGTSTLLSWPRWHKLPAQPVLLLQYIFIMKLGKAMGLCYP